jgi:hypothetical protein
VNDESVLSIGKYDEILIQLKVEKNNFEHEKSTVERIESNKHEAKKRLKKLNNSASATDDFLSSFKMKVIDLTQSKMQIIQVIQKNYMFI